jgi:beta-glucosidase
MPGDYNSDVRTAVNAGVDMVMVPYDYQLFINTLTAEVEAGNVSMARIDDAVSRILTRKFELGLFEQPFSDRTYINDIGSPAHRDVARQAVRESLVLLKNENNILPLSPDNNDILMAGAHANDIGLQSGGWTISWQGSSGNITPGTTILEGVQANVSNNTDVTYIPSPQSNQLSGYDAAIVVVGEQPYAEGQGDDADLQLSTADSQMVDRVCGAVPCIVVLVSGRPMIVETELNQSDAFVAAWLPGTEGDGVAEVLFGYHNFSGQLPMSWPGSVNQLPINVGDTNYDPLFPYGFGMTYP